MLEMKVIKCRNIILCEGIDEANFINAYLNSKEINLINNNFSKAVQFF